MIIKGKVTGAKGVIASLAAHRGTVRLAAESGLMEAGLYLKAASLKEVPRATGNLANSAYVKPMGMGSVAGDPVVEIGYSAVYALSVHENPRAGKTRGVSPQGKKYTEPHGVRWARGGNWKYLEGPANRLARTLRMIIRSAVFKAMGAK
jgi:hypothetical protein